MGGSETLGNQRHEHCQREWVGHALTLEFHPVISFQLIHVFPQVPNPYIPQAPTSLIQPILHLQLPRDRPSCLKLNMSMAELGSSPSSQPPTSGCRETPGPVCLTTNMEVDRHQEPLALEEFPSFIQSSPSPCDVLAEAFIIPPVHRSSYGLFSCSAHPLRHHFSLQKVKILTPQVNYWCPYAQPHCLLRVDQRGPGDILRTSPALHTYRISHIFVTQPQPLGC